MAKKRQFKDFAVTEEMKTFFWSRVKKGGPDDCWEWTGSKRSDGGGSYTYSQPGESGERKQRFISAPRVSWAINVGKVPTDKFITQTCGNKLCQNPKHLVACDHRKLMSTMRKGVKHHLGEKHGKSKLTDDDVLYIRKLWATKLLTLKDIYKIFPKVSRPMIGFICQGENWSHLPHYKPVKWVQSDTPPRPKITKKNGNRLFTNEQVVELRKRYKNGETAEELAKVFGCSVNSICWIVRGRTYKDAGGLE